jgi:hypothetical protein
MLSVAILAHHCAVMAAVYLGTNVDEIACFFFIPF